MSLQNLIKDINNLDKRICKIKFQYKHDGKKLENWGFKGKYCDCFLQYTNFKDDW